MHSYRKRVYTDENGEEQATYMVTFAPPGDPTSTVECGEFEQEDDAAAWASHLNGGEQPGVTPAKAKEALEAKAKKAKAAAANKLAQDAAHAKANEKHDDDDHGRRAARR